MSDGRLAQLNDEYEHIMHSIVGNKRYAALADLMARMEHEYNIPLMHDPGWEQENRDIIALYHKISMSRWR